MHKENTHLVLSRYELSKNMTSQGRRFEDGFHEVMIEIIMLSCYNSIIATEVK